MLLNTIANVRSPREKKPNKQACWNAVKALIEKTDENENLAELADLYAYFLPSVPTKPKSAEQWVMKAMAKGDVRFYLNNVYVDKGRLVATDGHRLHILTGTSLKDGEFYDKALCQLDNSDNQCGTYPDIDRVIPKWSSLRHEGILELDDLEQRVIKPDSGTPYTASIIKVERGGSSNSHVVEIGVQTSYLADALSFMKSPNYYVSETNPDNSSILVKDEGHDLEAILMPIRL